MFAITTTGRIISFAWKNFTRNAWIGLATLLVLILSILSVNILLGVNAVSDTAMKALEDKIDISVYFKPETPVLVLDTARSYMASLPQSQEVDMRLPEAVLEDFKLRHQGDEKVLAALAELDQNPFGATMTVKAHNTSDYPFLVEALQNPQFAFAIETKTYDDNAVAISRVEHIAESVRLFGIILITIFALFSILIVYNSIRIAVYTQREELGIMRLVGASNLFVKAPLVLSGVVQALLAMFLSAGVVVLMVAFLDPKLKVFFDGSDPGLQSYFMNNFMLLAGVQAVAILCLVIFSSWAATGRYLKK